MSDTAVLDTPPATDTLKGTVDTWKETLPPDLKDNPTIKSTKSITDMASQLVNAQKLVGGRIPIPKDGDEKAWNDVYTKLGRPESADKYTITRPAVDEKSGIQYDANQEKAFLTEAHKLGLNSKQANALVNWQFNNIKASVDAANQQRTQGEEQLKREWGNNYQERISGVQRVVAEYAQKFPGLVETIERTGVGNDPNFIKFFHAISEGMGLLEDKGKAEEAGQSRGGMSKEDAQAEMNNLKLDKEFMKTYMSNRSPGHKEAVARMFALQEIISGVEPIVM